jgi:acetoin utilization protein AcuB
MLVKDVMDHHPVTVTPDTPVAEVRQLIRERQTYAIPVNEKRKSLKGLATRPSLMINPDMVGSHDIATLSKMVAELKIKKAMIKGPDLMTIQPDQTIEETSKLMLDEAVGSLPVVEDKVLVGLITRDDLLAQLTEMMGSNIPCIRVTLRIPTVKGEIAKLTAALSQGGLGIYANETLSEKSGEGYWHMVVKIRNTTMETVKEIINTIPDHRIIDIREM